MYKLTILLAAFTLLLNSCLPPCEEYIEGSLPSSPVNLEAFNSEYDDYNASAPVLGAFIPFCFSTNRNSEGGDFDIIYEPMTIDWDMQTGDINIYNDFGDWLGAMQEYSVLNNALQLINTDGNQLGPNIILNSGSYFSEYDFLFMYASDEGGDYQIGFTYNLDSPYFSECQEIDFLNSPYDDLYPSFNMDYNQVYFCSDRDNDVFNIYSVDLTRDIDRMVQEFKDTAPREISMNDILSSDYNDKCPYIYGRLMVFASDRPGGEGGFDLYYSIYSGGEWGEPLNFGPAINSPYDDYRPIIVNDGVDYVRNMMIFSSDRPGGQGGFDLYYVGITL